MVIFLVFVDLHLIKEEVTRHLDIGDQLVERIYLVSLKLKDRTSNQKQWILSTRHKGILLSNWRPAELLSRDLNSSDTD
jgi:hypothetical protein